MIKKQIISISDLKNIEKIKRPIVFLPMAVDFLHHGHVRIIKKANKYGSVVVGLMTDKGLQSYKGKPILNYKQRKEILSEIKNIKYIIPLNGLKYCEISKVLKVNFFVHGNDWKKGTQSKERKRLINLLKGWKGKVIDLPYTKNISSSKIKTFINNLSKN